MMKRDEIGQKWRDKGRKAEMERNKKRGQR